MPQIIPPPVSPRLETITVLGGESAGGFRSIGQAARFIRCKRAKGAPLRFIHIDRLSHVDYYELGDDNITITKTGEQ